jgi:RiboL-PSP-HEPN
MPLTRIENAIAICKSHLDSIDINNPDLIEIETYIVSALILIIASAYEDLIERLFGERATKCGDNHVSSYVQSTISQKFRSPDLGKIAEVLSKFGSDYRESFHNNIMNTEAHAAWDNIMKARHAIVHKRGNLNITFRELEITYPKTISVINELKNVLGII